MLRGQGHSVVFQEAEYVAQWDEGGVFGLIFDIKFVFSSRSGRLGAWGGARGGYVLGVLSGSGLGSASLPLTS